MKETCGHPGSNAPDGHRCPKCILVKIWSTKPDYTDNFFGVDRTGTPYRMSPDYVPAKLTLYQRLRAAWRAFKETT
jgi:hypothetical protein